MNANEEVHNADTAFRSALNQGDVKTIQRMNYPDGNSFYIDNNLLMPDPNQQEWEQIFAAGTKFDFQLRHEEIQVFGNSSVVCGYLVGSVTAPGLGAQSGTWRYTGIWIKTEREWQYYHAHLSLLSPTHTSL